LFVCAVMCAGCGVCVDVQVVWSAQRQRQQGQQAGLGACRQSKERDRSAGAWSSLQFVCACASESLLFAALHDLPLPFHPSLFHRPVSADGVHTHTSDPLGHSWLGYKIKASTPACLNLTVGPHALPQVPLQHTLVFALPRPPPSMCVLSQPHCRGMFASAPHCGEYRPAVKVSTCN
jgi:hypothetical protein